MEGGIEVFVSLVPSTWPTDHCSHTEMIWPHAHVLTVPPHFAASGFPWSHRSTPSLLGIAQKCRQLMSPRTVFNQWGWKLPQSPTVSSCNPQANSEGFLEVPRGLEPQLLGAVINPTTPVLIVLSTLSTLLVPCFCLLGSLPGKKVLNRWSALRGTKTKTWTTRQSRERSMPSILGKYDRKWGKQLKCSKSQFGLQAVTTSHLNYSGSHLTCPSFFPDNLFSSQKPEWPFKTQ